ncbi:MAG: TetR/AcrR family transcriptional regulator [Deltaproteobacteria bacterium]|nr:TetR/AcrR family transcriptional regulator [Deltaproteobacteria bacterium]
MNTGQSKKIARRAKEREGRRAEILSAAREVFFAKGFMNATVGEIASASSLAKGTLYLYFKSKEEMYCALTDEGMALLQRDLMESLDRPLRPDRSLAALVKAYHGFYQGHPEYFRMMFLTIQPDVRSKVPQETLEASVGKARECLGAVADIFRKGVETGLFKKNVDPWSAANTIWAMINGVIMAYEDPIYRDEIASVSLESALDGCLRMALNGVMAVR